MKRVRAGSTYVYMPALIDRVDPVSFAQPGEIVRVIDLPRAPKANTMRQCYVESVGGEFLGMVSTSSLRPVQNTPTRRW